MRINVFAPHLAGRMLPALFSAMPFAKKPRFLGDPWATFPHLPQWHWMHSSACNEDERGCRFGLCCTRRIVDALRDHELPRQDSPQVLKAERASAEATAGEIPATTSPGVGPMGAGQPADAGPAGGQVDLFAEI